MTHRGAFLKLPLNLSEGLGDSLRRCSQEESIAQQIMLLITSRQGEVIGKDSYGTIIWELEFHQAIKFRDWEERVRESLHQAITEHEKRLTHINVKVHLSEVNETIQDQKLQLRRQAVIKVAATIDSTNQPFHFETIVYVSPLSQ